MQEVTFDLQTITPLFLTGADVSTTELRPPSFRGEMRYWLRALLGGLIGTDDKGLKLLVAEEEQIFGSTETASGVMVHLSQNTLPAITFQRESSGRDVTGRDYLFWSMNRSGSYERNNFKPARKYIPAATHFQLTLSARYGYEHALKRGVAALWLLTHLGGIGSRSRRCAGSLQITGDFPPFSFDIPRTSQDLSTQLSHGIRIARELFAHAPIPLRDPTFDVLSSDYARIWILRNEDQPWKSADAALQAIGTSLQNYRANKPLAKRSIFGLPLKNIDTYSRVASPLLLRLAKLQGENYVGIAVLFKTHIAKLNFADYKLIEQWVTEEFPRALKVEL